VTKDAVPSNPQRPQGLRRDFRAKVRNLAGNAEIVLPSSVAGALASRITASMRLQLPLFDAETAEKALDFVRCHQVSY
jgi:hypothetical protein